MNAEIIDARRPEEVARVIEELAQRGCRSFVIRSLDRGGMLDLERLGAARYAAGLHSRVELEVRAPAAAVR